MQHFKVAFQPNQLFDTLDVRDSPPFIGSFEYKCFIITSSE